MLALRARALGRAEGTPWLMAAASPKLSARLRWRLHNGLLLFDAESADETILIYPFAGGWAVSLSRFAISISVASRNTECLPQLGVATAGLDGPCAWLLHGIKGCSIELLSLHSPKCTQARRHNYLANPFGKSIHLETKAQPRSSMQASHA